MKRLVTTVYSSSCLINNLFDSKAFPHTVSGIQLIETHISWVLLTGCYAYKFKKPVKFGFLDFSTLAKRQFYCQEEVRLNQRLAKDWYLGVVSITGHPDHPVIAGTGQAIEYAVQMIQFPSTQTLRETAESGQLSIGEIDQVSQIIAEFHNAVEKADIQSPFGDSIGIKHWFEENFHHIRLLLDDKRQLTQLKAIESWGQDEWANQSELMQKRKRQGHVRECHGDLHLGNMSLIKGKVVIFDCIEFNPMLRWIDVVSDMAFLVMDLIHLGHEAYANRFLNRYLQFTGDYEGLALLRYYFVYRALVRAKVALLRVAQTPDAAVCARIRSEYSLYADLAEQFTQPKRTELFITHGFSGSGKSTYAGQLAEKIGAIQIRSDIERKRLFGYSPNATTTSGIESGIYTVEAGQQTYLHLSELAKAVLEAGFSAIIDATFLKKGQRDIFKQLARELKIKFTIIDFQAPEAVLCERIKQRQDDPSEATIDVLQQQRLLAQPLAKEEQGDVIAVQAENDNILGTLLTRLGFFV